jgi:hypothetical protein
MGLYVEVSIDINPINLQVKPVDGEEDEFFGLHKT